MLRPKQEDFEPQFFPHELHLLADPLYQGPSPWHPFIQSISHLTHGHDAVFCLNFHLTCAGSTDKKGQVQRALICDVTVTVERVDGLKEAS